MRVRLPLIVCILLCGFSCRTDEQAPPGPAPVERKAEATPDIIKIAVWFVRFEGIDAELTVGSGRVVSQDRDAYYVGFQRKILRPHRVREVLIKVYKKNGLAEWEEY
jgi:hypothetical protein